MTFRRSVNLLGLVLSSLLIAQILVPTAFAVEAQTEEELAPWCANKQIWATFNVSKEQCLAVAVPCSEAVAVKTEDLREAITLLYECVYSELGIEIPSFDF